MKTPRDDLSHAEELLPKAHRLTDDTITLSRTNNPEDIVKAIETLATAAQYQNVVLKNLCSAMGRLYKAVEKG